MGAMSITVPVKFEDSREFLKTHKRVDGEAYGASPITIRWLNKKNTYVNIGMEDFVNTTMLTPNNNSYGVTHDDLCEVADELTKHFIKGESSNAKVEDQPHSPEWSNNPVASADESPVLTLGRISEPV